MLLAVDIGNSNIVFGLFKEECLCSVYRIGTNRNLSDYEYFVIIKDLLITDNYQISDIKKAIISATVPTLIDIFIQLIKKNFNILPIVIEPGIKTGLKLKMDNPIEVGADLIVSGVAASHIYGDPVVIIDLGTATTLTYISKGMVFEGGIIIPGIQTSNNALIEKATQLPHVKFEAPNKIIGKNTKDAINSGSIYGTATMIDGLIEKIYQEVKTTFKVIITGGLSSKIISYLVHDVIYDENLILKGLNIIYYKNVR